MCVCVCVRVRVCVRAYVCACALVCLIVSFSRIFLIYFYVCTESMYKRQEKHTSSVLQFYMKIPSYMTKALLFTSTVLCVNVLSWPVERKTTYGPIIGKSTETPHGVVELFLDIPFAQPPTGDLRFRRPVPPIKNWTLPRLTQENLHMCPQLDVAGPLHLGEEDCLYLDVTAPTKDKCASAGCPVMHFIYGGGWWLGDKSSGGQYDAKRLAAEHGFVVVVPNYRVDVFGYLALDQFRSEDPSNSTGNFATLDQRFALNWVQDNIRNFNGDPTKVTIFGGSAGGFAVCQHVAHPMSYSPRRLFRSAIMQSGGCDSTLMFQPLNRAMSFGEYYAAQCGCNHTADPSLDIAQCMRERTTTELLLPIVDWFEKKWLVDRPSFLPPFAPVLNWGPVLDFSSVGIPQLPIETLTTASEGAKPVPMIIGTNKDEGSIFEAIVPRCVNNVTLPLKNDFGKLEYILSSVFGNYYNDSSLGNKILTYYQTQGPSSVAKLNADALLKLIIRDCIFLCGSRRAAKTLFAGGGDVYVYEFEYNSSEFPKHSLFLELGDYHGSEMPFVWNNLPINPTPTNDDKNMASIFQRYWSSMVASLSPNNHISQQKGIVPEWPIYNTSNSHNTSGKGAWLRLKLDPESSVTLDFPCEFWDPIRERNL